MNSKVFSFNEDVLKKTAKRCKERNIIIPTIAQQKNPELRPDNIKQKLKNVGLWDVDPINLFRITWKNDINTGLFKGVNYIEIPESITVVRAKIVVQVRK